MDKEQWTAIINRDRSYDGKFFYGLKTTKKFCRPHCPKQSYNPRRIVIFASVEEAARSGYLPCSRCHPDLPDWTDAKTELARSAEAYIRAHYAEKFSLSTLAEAMHVDKAYLARSFKSVKGVTLLDFCNHVRCEYAREMLTHPELSISYISSTVGYVSASHFSQVFRKEWGCTPSEYRENFFRSLELSGA
ncbi:MAG: methylphosphotriester-DNA--protein-cysteine methyltransferase family protein [Oscillospiraceae bacterium]|nr:methylphosphotriester-DNA--protein-cysteine methyltransferase family protein [Oscillospiraceae bacterium]